MKFAVHPDVVSVLQSDCSVECGWLLLGRASESGIDVSSAVPAGKGDASSVSVDLEQALEAVDLCRRNQTTVVGFAHSHPTGRSEPSIFDFRGDSRWVEELPDRAGVFGIIAKGMVKWFYLASGDRWYRCLA